MGNALNFFLPLLKLRRAGGGWRIFLIPSTSGV
jgi:hypothetical protein